VSTVPGAADQIADLPFARDACCRAEGDDSADEFMAQSRNVRRTHAAGEHIVVAVTNTTGVDFEQNLAYGRLEHGHAFDLERLVFAGDDGCLEGRWEVG
jgi:hypothetical protein